MRVGVKLLPLACCAVEASAAVALDLPAAVADVEVSEYQSDADFDLVVLVVAGTVTKAGGPVLREVWQELPEPKLAVAYGVCAVSGGPYWDSYAVSTGAAEFVPVARFVPGCPPPRSTLLNAVLAVAGAEVPA